MAIDKPAAICLCLLTALVHPEAHAESPADWTMLVYMNANNNLEPEAIDNFQQMEAVGSDKSVKVIVEFARRGNDARYGAWNSTYRFEVSRGKDPIRANAVQDLGIKDMGDGRTLEEFVRWGKATYPANHYMLVIWDHGQGWRLMNLLTISAPATTLRRLDVKRRLSLVRANGSPSRGVVPSGSLTQALSVKPNQGIPNPVKASSYDETSGHMLYNRQLAESIATALGGAKVDVLAFDACLMAMVESAYAFRDVAKYFVGSEELEPGPGWDYKAIISALEQSPTVDEREASTLIVDAYKQTYGATGQATTMSAMSLAGTQQLATGLTAVAAALVTQLRQAPQGVLSSRKACNAYGASYGYTGVDIQCFLDALSKNVHDGRTNAAVTQTKLALSSYVVSAYASSNRQAAFGSHGVAIYFPPDGAWFNNDPDHDAYTKAGANAVNAIYPVEFVQKGGWADFIAAYTARFPDSH